MATGTQAVGVERHGWAGAYESVARPKGVIVLGRTLARARGTASDRVVCDVLHDYRLSTLLFDPPTEACDVVSSSGRVLEALDWLQERDDVRRIRVGLFGADLGAAAVLWAAAQRPGRSAAVVSCSGRLDVVASCLPNVQAVTLLIVGGDDAGIVRAHRVAMRALTCSKRLEIVPCAGPLLDEPAALDTAVHLAAEWFADRLPAG